MSRETELIAITASFLVFATVVLVLRLYTRFVLVRNAGAEDLLVGFAWVSCIPVFTGFLRMRRPSQSFSFRYTSPVCTQVNKLYQPWSNHNQKADRHELDVHIEVLTTEFTKAAESLKVSLSSSNSGDTTFDKSSDSGSASICTTSLSLARNYLSPCNTAVSSPTERPTLP